MNSRAFLSALLLLLVTGLTQSARAQCPSSSADPEFFHYREGAPERSLLFSNNEERKPLRIVGTLISEQCQPIPNALVEIWGATPEGCHSGEQGCDDRGDPYFLRGSIRTDEFGRFTATTLFPGKYLVGDRIRPAHINLRIKTEVSELVTQMYFEGDELIASDSSASHPSSADRILTVYEEGAERAVILTLTMNATASVSKKLSETIHVYPAIFHDRLTLKGTIAPGTSTKLLDLHGRDILMAKHIISDRDLFDRDMLVRLSSGVYYLLLESSTDRHLVKLIKQ